MRLFPKISELKFGPPGANRPVTPNTLQPQHGAEAFPVDLRPKSGGHPLPGQARLKMATASGADFPDVRVHIGREAHSVGAIASTWGSYIHFAPGQYNPHALQGQKLLGHELTHVLQQHAGHVKNPAGPGVAVVQDRGLEAKADRMGLRAGKAPKPLKAGTAAIQTKLAAAAPVRRPLVVRSPQIGPARPHAITAAGRMLNASLNSHRATPAAARPVPAANGGAPPGNPFISQLLKPVFPLRPTKKAPPGKTTPVRTAGASSSLYELPQQLAVSTSKGSASGPPPRPPFLGTAAQRMQAPPQQDPYVKAVADHATKVANKITNTPSSKSGNYSIYFGSDKINDATGAVDVEKGKVKAVILELQKRQWEGPETSFSSELAMYKWKKGRKVKFKFKAPSPK